MINDIRYQQIQIGELTGTFAYFLKLGDESGLSAVETLKCIDDYATRIHDRSKLVVLDLRGVDKFSFDMSTLINLLGDHQYSCIAYIDSTNIPPFYKMFRGIVQFIKTGEYVPVKASLLVYEPDVKNMIPEIILREPPETVNTRKVLLIEKDNRILKDVVNFTAESKYLWSVFFKGECQIVYVLYTSSGQEGKTEA